jgi:hypothetical protein
MPVTTSTVTTGWVRFEPITCDLCRKVATWKHPAGGLRCDTCPKPKDQPRVNVREATAWCGHAIKPGTLWCNRGCRVT